MDSTAGPEAASSTAAEAGSELEPARASTSAATADLDADLEAAIDTQTVPQGTQHKRKTSTPPLDTGSIMSADSVDNRCRICLGQVQDLCTPEGCGHEFCNECLLKWAYRSNTCPMCRQVFDYVIQYEDVDDQEEEQTKDDPEQDAEQPKSGKQSRKISRTKRISARPPPRRTGGSRRRVALWVDDPIDLTGPDTLNITGDLSRTGREPDQIYRTLYLDNRARGHHRGRPNYTTTDLVIHRILTGMFFFILVLVFICYLSAVITQSELRQELQARARSRASGVLGYDPQLPAAPIRSRAPSNTSTISDNTTAPLTSPSSDDPSSEATVDGYTMHDLYPDGLPSADENYEEFHDLMSSR